MLPETQLFLYLALSGACASLTKWAKSDEKTILLAPTVLDMQLQTKVNTERDPDQRDPRMDTIG